jgi:hypothetical protein
MGRTGPVGLTAHVLADCSRFVSNARNQVDRATASQLGPGVTTSSSRGRLHPRALVSVHDDALASRWTHPMRVPVPTRCVRSRTARSRGQRADDDDKCVGGNRWNGRRGHWNRRLYRRRVSRYEVRYRTGLLHPRWDVHLAVSRRHRLPQADDSAGAVDPRLGTVRFERRLRCQ